MTWADGTVKPGANHRNGVYVKLWSNGNNRDMRMGELKPDTSHSRGVGLKRGQAAMKKKYVLVMPKASGKSEKATQ